MKMLWAWLLASVVACWAQTSSNATCRDINLSLVVYCKDYINEAWAEHYQVPGGDLFNETDADDSAVFYSMGNTCPYYNSLDYQCNKFFQRCESKPEQDGGGATVYKLCQEVCERYRTWQGGICSRVTDQECQDSEYYANPPLCYMIDYGEEEQSQVLQYVMGGILGGIGVVLGISLAYSYYKDKTWKPANPNDPYAEETKPASQKRSGEGYEALDPTAEEEHFKTAQEARQEALERQDRYSQRLSQEHLSSSAFENAQGTIAQTRQSTELVTITQ